MRFIILAFFFSASVISQTYDPLGYKWFKGIQNKGSVLSDSYTGVVVFDPTTGQYGHILKSSLGSGSTPTFQQVLTAGNISNISAVSGVKSFEITSPNTTMAFFGGNILTSNSTTQADYGLNGFIFKLNDNSRRVKFDLDGLELKTSATTPPATINTNNITGARAYQFEDLSGKLAVINKIALDTYIGPRVQPNEDALGWHVTKSANKVVGFSAENTDDTSNGSMSNITLRGSGPLYTNNTGISHFGANYFISYLRGNGALYSDKDLNIIGSGATSIIDFRTGSDIQTATSKFRISNNGTLNIGIAPTADNTASILGRKSNGDLATVSLSSTYVDMTSTQSSIGGVKTFTSQAFFNNGIALGDALGNFTISYSPANGLTWRENNIPRMTLADKVLIIGNYTNSVNARLDITNITAERTHFLPDKSGTIALTNDITPVVRVPNAAATPNPSGYSGGAILIIEDTNKMYRNSGTKWLGL